MSELTRDEVLLAVHPLDDATISEIIATGATSDELRQACVYVRDDLAGNRAPINNARVERVVTLIERHGLSVRHSYFGEAGSVLR